MVPPVPLLVRAPRGVSSGFVVAAIAVLLAACANDAKDSHCEPDGSDDRCTSDPAGNGPAVQEPVCAAPAAGEAPSGDCPDFWSVAAFMADPERGNCVASGCHGSQGTAAVGIYFPLSRDAEGNPQFDGCELYTIVSAQSGSVGRPYLKADDPETPDNESLQSWMYCNVTGLPGGGYPMPKPGGVHRPEDAQVIRDFILCGAPSPCEPDEGT